MTCGSPGAELRGSAASHELGLERSARGVVEERRGANRCVDGDADSQHGWKRLRHERQDCRRIPKMRIEASNRTPEAIGAPCRAEPLYPDRNRRESGVTLGFGWRPVWAAGRSS